MKQKRKKDEKPVATDFQSDDRPIASDVLGSWTGTPVDEKDKPIQDADDL